MKKLLLLLLFISAFSCKEEAKESEVYIVNMTPKDTLTLKASDLFESARVYSIENDMEAYIYDSKLVNDKIFLVSDAGRRNSIYATELMVYDSIGGYEYTIGAYGKGHGEYLSAGTRIYLNDDNTVSLYSSINRELRNYDIDGKYNWVKRYNLTPVVMSKGDYVSGEIYCQSNKDDFLRYNIRGTYKNYLLAFSHKDSLDKMHSPLLEYDGDNIDLYNKIINYCSFYKYDDMINFYNTLDNGIYQIDGYEAKLRYKISADDKDYGLERHYKFHENSRYLIHMKYPNAIIFDKNAKKSYVLELIDDFMLPSAIDSKYCKLGPSFDKTKFDGYLVLTPTRLLTVKYYDEFMNAKVKMSEEDWANYIKERADMMTLLDKLPKEMPKHPPIPQVSFAYKLKP